MSGKDSGEVTLALVDPSLLSSWEEMVKRGEECSLLLLHSKGKITATLQCTKPAPSSSLATASPSPPQAKRKKNKGSKERRLKSLLAYHQRLVDEKGLPPSRLMEQHAVAPDLNPSNPEQISDAKKVQCEQCDFSTNSQRGLKVHIRRAHKLIEPEVLREDYVHEVSLNTSNLNAKREDDAQAQRDVEEQPEEQVKIAANITPEQRALFMQMFSLYSNLSNSDTKVT